MAHTSDVGVGNVLWIFILVTRPPRGNTMPRGARRSRRKPHQKKFNPQKEEPKTFNRFVLARSRFLYLSVTVVVAWAAKRSEFPGFRVLAKSSPLGRRSRSPRVTVWCHTVTPSCPGLPAVLPDDLTPTVQKKGRIIPLPTLATPAG